MAIGQLKIHTENLLPIIKKWLYSDKDIFLRELIANGCDALHKLRVLRDNGEVQFQDEELRIQVSVDKTARTLTVSDTGIGMEAEEVEKYICQIAFSGAEEFLNKYSSHQEGDQIIGHFGLGFFSAYMVASKVDIETLSYRPGAEAVAWSSDGSSNYTLEKGDRTTRGTSVILHLDEESSEFLELSRLREIMRHYCAFLPYPIYLEGEQINPKQPLWVKSPSECTEKDYLDFYQQLYPGAEEPIYWVHLNVDYPFHLKGILYFPHLQKQMELRTQNIKLFCNRVFVSDSCKDVIPDYLMVLRGALDSPDIPLNVSRSYLQMDRTVRQLGGHISKKVSDALLQLYKNDKERFLKSWKDLSVIVKLGALEDEKFYERVKTILLWKVNQNDWITVEEYLERNREKSKDRILYTMHEKHATHLLEMYHQKGIEVLIADSPIDSYLIHFLERKVAPATFQRIDAGVDESMIDSSREKTILDAEGKTEAGRLADLVRRSLDEEDIEVEAKSLAHEAVPALITMDEQLRRLRDYMHTVNPEDTALRDQAFAKRTLVVNTNNPLLQAIQKLNQSDPELADELVHEVYDLALLSQRELPADSLQEFVIRSQKLLEKLATRTLQTKGPA